MPTIGNFWTLQKKFCILMLFHYTCLNRSLQEVVEVFIEEDSIATDCHCIGVGILHYVVMLLPWWLIIDITVELLCRRCTDMRRWGHCQKLPRTEVTIAAHCCCHCWSCRTAELVHLSVCCTDSRYNVVCSDDCHCLFFD